MDRPCESRTPQNTVLEGQGAHQGGQQGGWGGQGRLGWGDQTSNNGLADSSFPEQAFSNVLSPVEGGRRGLSARGPEKQLFGPRAALGGGRKRVAWSSVGPPTELLALINMQN